MSEILETTLATSQPRNLTRGFPFFHSGTLNQPQQTTIIGLGAVPTISMPLFSADLPLALYRIRCNVNGTIVAGAFFGYNLEYSVLGGTNSDGTALAIFRNDAAQGGLGLGFGFTLNLSFDIQRTRITFTWRSGFRQSWERWFNASATATIDFIELTLRILEAGGVNVPMARVDQLAGTIRNGAIWGLYDSVSGQLASRPAITLNPRMSVSGNLLRFMPAVAEVVTGLKKIGMKLFFGPVLNLVFPVTIRVVAITTDDGRYATVTRRRNGTIDFSGGPQIPIGQPPTTKIAVTHTHEIDVALTLDIKLTFGMWGIFSLGGTFPINLGAAFPIQVGTRGLLGPYFNELSNQGQVAVELPEVIWG